LNETQQPGDFSSSQPPNQPQDCKILTRPRLAFVPGRDEWRSSPSIICRRREDGQANTNSAAGWKENRLAAEFIQGDIQIANLFVFSADDLGLRRSLSQRAAVAGFILEQTETSRLS